MFTTNINVANSDKLVANFKAALEALAGKPVVSIHVEFEVPAPAVEPVPAEPVITEHE